MPDIISSTGKKIFLHEKRVCIRKQILRKSLQISVVRLAGVGGL